MFKQSLSTPALTPYLILLIIFLSFAGCEPENLTLEADSTFATMEAPIANELEDGVAERTYFQYFDGDVTHRSYGEGLIDGPGLCSATMIGPNVMMTAAHCKTTNRNIKFRTYTTADTQDTETFNCDPIAHTFIDTDLALYWCDSNSYGEAPGDKYGYADPDLVMNPNGSVNVEASRALVSENKTLYSIWQNDISSLSTGWHHLYSKGKITSAFENGGWFCPADEYDPTTVCGNFGNNGLLPHLNRNVKSDLWCQPGASGSASFSTNNNRMLLGPLSVGAVDNTGRQQMAFIDYLFYGEASNHTCTNGQASEPQIYATTLTNLGLTNTSQYLQNLDSDLNGIFDLQEDLEKVHGESARQWYWLGFESIRRNALWTHEAESGIQFNTASATEGTLTLNPPKPTPWSPFTHLKPMLSHQDLNLDAGKSYRISFTYDMSSSNMVVKYLRRLSGFEICLTGSSKDCKQVNTKAGLSFKDKVFVTTLKASADAKLEINVREDTTLVMRNLSVVYKYASMDFDSNDKRSIWFENGTNRAKVWPNGYKSKAQNGPDWAGAVKAHGIFGNFDLNTDVIRLEFAEHKICFHSKNSTRDPVNSSHSGRLQVKAGDTIVNNTNFNVSQNWEWKCTPWFKVTDSKTKISFGAMGWLPQGTYLVDNILFIKK